MPRHSLTLGLAVVLVGVLSACSGGASPAPSAVGSTPTAAAVAPTSAPSAGTAATGGCKGIPVTFCGHIKISGGVARDTDFTSSIFSLSCAAWLKGNKDDATLLTLPIALVGDVNTDTVVQAYTGPGSYDVASLGGNLGGFQVVVGTDRFTTDSKTTGTAVVAADGSGSVKASGLQPAGSSNKVQQPIDLSLTWTCYGP
jgi:hypothetical protein